MFLKGQKYLSRLISIGLLVCLAGCGKGDGGVGERLSGPAADSALPIRIDATITPTITTTPQESEQIELEENIQEKPEATELETRLNMLSPTPATTPVPTPTTNTEKILPEKATPIAPSPPPSPVPTPLPETAGVKSEETPPVKETAKSALPKEKQNSSKAKATTQKEETQVAESQKESSQLPPSQSSSAKMESSEKPPPKSTPIMTASGITLSQIAICSKISNRNPSGVGDTFSLSTFRKVYTWMKVSGARPPMVLKHIYYWEGKLVATIKLKIKYSSMRTWSQKTFKPLEALGKWKVLITTENEDEILAVKEFTVVP